MDYEIIIALIIIGFTFLVIQLIRSGREEEAFREIPSEKGTEVLENSDPEVKTVKKVMQYMQN